MHAACEDGTQHNPQECRRTIEDTHDSTEDRTQSCNIEKLHEEDSPRFHRYKIYSIGFGDSRRLCLGVDTKHTLHECTVENEAEHEGYE